MKHIADSTQLTQICGRHTWLHKKSEKHSSDFTRTDSTSWNRSTGICFTVLRYIYKNIYFAVWRYEIPSMSFGRAWVCVCVCVCVCSQSGATKSTKIHSVHCEMIGLLHSVEVWNPHTYSNTLSIAIQYYSIDSIDMSLLRKVTYKDKGSYESSPPCIYSRYWVLL